MAQSLAERLRRHREEMELALQLKVSPREARAILDQRAARARWEATYARLQTKMNGAAVGEFERIQPWYQQGTMA